MRNNCILHGIVLTFVGTLCSSVCTAAPPTRANSLRQFIPQIASDTIGFDSGLWRSEYLQQPMQNEDADNASEPESLTTATTSGIMKSPPPEFVYSDKLVTIRIDTPALIGTQLHEANGQSDLVGETTMSEWENAVAKSGVSATPGSTASGPSITSAIVGFVGIMIVIGAYVSSGKRNC